MLFPRSRLASPRLFSVMERLPPHSGGGAGDRCVVERRDWTGASKGIMGAATPRNGRSEGRRVSRLGCQGSRMESSPDAKMKLGQHLTLPEAASTVYGPGERLERKRMSKESRKGRKEWNHGAVYHAWVGLSPLARTWRTYISLVHVFLVMHAARLPCPPRHYCRGDRSGASPAPRPLFQSGGEVQQLDL